MMEPSHREFELILWGATGYTGRLTAEYIVKTLPTGLKWAIAGRTESKLNSLARPGGLGAGKPMPGMYIHA